MLRVYLKNHKGNTSVLHYMTDPKQVDAVEHSKNPKSRAIKYARANLSNDLTGFYVEKLEAC